MAFQAWSGMKETSISLASTGVASYIEVNIQIVLQNTSVTFFGIPGGTDPCLHKIFVIGKDHETRSRSNKACICTSTCRGPPSHLSQHHYAGASDVSPLTSFITNQHPISNLSPQVVGTPQPLSIDIRTNDLLGLFRNPVAVS